MSWVSHCQRSMKRNGSSRPGFVSLQVAVDLFPVSHSHDEHDENLVPDLVDHAVVLAWAYIQAVELFFGFELLHSVGAGIVFQPEDVAGNVLSDVGIELAYIPFGGGREFNAVGQ